MIKLQHMMAILIHLLILVSTCLNVSYASPMTNKREALASVVPLSTSQISAFKPFTFFAGAAHCPPTTTINWTCGGWFPFFCGGSPK